MSALRGAVHARWIIGKVIGTKMRKTAKVRVTRLVLDPYLLKQCIEGDIVLLKALPVRRSKHVKHELAEIVYKVGKVIDPVTGKPCAGSKLLESVTDSENLTDRDTSYLSEKLQELTVSSSDK
uniref:28S ribosomal protein S17, mitochondrial isoform X2 n=1 Tax=Euleptes europaea TaxID=460621 RepID=UPI0025424C92|nr:28S ribosomal protein S17, mitochondrial isoform X2 [Euleptes europaea]